jgi:hypothetical protein
MLLDRPEWSAEPGASELAGEQWGRDTIADLSLEDRETGDPGHARQLHPFHHAGTVSMRVTPSSSVRHTMARFLSFVPVTVGPVRAVELVGASPILEIRLLVPMFM